MTKANGLASRAVLVRFHKRVPNFTVEAITASQSTRDHYHVTDRTVAKVMTRRMPKEFLSEARRIAGDFYNNQHTRMTLPWSDNEGTTQDGGARLCSTRRAGDWRKAVLKAEAEFWEAVNTDIKRFREYVARIDEMAGGLADQITPPTLAEVKEKLAFGWSIEPVPTTPDIRNPDLDDDTVEVMKSGTAAKTARNEKAAHLAALTRIIEETTVMVDAMTRHGKVNEETGRAATFRNSFEKNIESFVDAIQGFNISNDPDLQRVIDAAVEKFDGIDNETLREDSKARARFKKDASVIRKSAKDQLKAASAMSL